MSIEFTNEEAIIAEIHKCRENPYYFATQYLTIGNDKFTINLSEDEFNKRFNELEANLPIIRGRGFYGNT